MLNQLCGRESKTVDAQVVVDFFKTSCGSCRYIQPGFVKLCKASEERHSPVMFLRHNIFDEFVPHPGHLVQFQYCEAGVWSPILCFCSAKQILNLAEVHSAGMRSFQIFQRSSRSGLCHCSTSSRMVRLWRNSRQGRDAALQRQSICTPAMKFLTPINRA